MRRVADTGSDVARGAKRTGGLSAAVATLLCVVALQTLAGCIVIPVEIGGGSDFPAPPVPTYAQGRPAELSSQEAEAYRLVNQHRASRGLPPLALDGRVAEIARAHSRAMAEGASTFGHEGFGGRSAVIQRLLPVRLVAENVAYDSREPAAASIVPGWIGSPSHRAHIEGRYTVTGIGAARAPDGTSYFTQIFLATR